MHFGKEDVNLSLLADDMIATFKFILKKSKNKKKGGDKGGKIGKTIIA